MRIAIVSDAWTPQVNGVVRTLQAVSAELRAAGHEVLVIGPDRFRSIPCPTYPEIRLALAAPRRIGAILSDFRAEAIHLATEGPLGLAARRWCLTQGLSFTTAYHTQFPDYVAARSPVPAAAVWRYVRWFHQPSSAVLASTARVEATLRAHGIGHVRRWTRGVDTGLFSPEGKADPTMAALPRPVQLYVGRVAVEKNVAAFLATVQPGSKVVVGDGPARAGLAAAFPAAHFLGSRVGEDLAACYRAADVLVFPSRTDTFGLVMVEALACGTPVAAFRVPGPLDILDEQVGSVDDDLDTAIARALTIDRRLCAARGRCFSWADSARQFAAALRPFTPGAAPAPTPPGVRERRKAARPLLLDR